MGWSVEPLPRRSSKSVQSVEKRKGKGDRERGRGVFGRDVSDLGWGDVSAAAELTARIGTQ